MKSSSAVRSASAYSNRINQGRLQGKITAGADVNDGGKPLAGLLRRRVNQVGKVACAEKNAMLHPVPQHCVAEGLEGPGEGELPVECRALQVNISKVVVEALVGVPDEGGRCGAKHFLFANVLKAEDDSFWNTDRFLTAENFLAVVKAGVPKWFGLGALKQMEDVFGGGVAEAATLIRGVLFPVANECRAVEQLAILPLFGGIREWGAKGCKHLEER